MISGVEPIFLPALRERGQVGAACAPADELPDRRVRPAPPDGLLSATMADYATPTACEIPEPVLLHRETPSPITPLGAKGVAEGNSMSTPVCIANAVADALGVDHLNLPLSPAKLIDLLRGTDVPT